ncbi:prenyl cysteine carboxyl methyltransferas-like protein Ste14 [Macrophomina phaseolina]|uniref:Protein-S-isoprenylcysteine O-methyltransferase n=1 Tax=Macrophomina phaseolina TaxID=35725 RepID=A0ABQ8GQZ2_9PEZI|nr:prenyl cysteine carboxyl methyltransferas-like protein Ste14 [Macrophomina phaseolina]
MSATPNGAANGSAARSANTSPHNADPDPPISWPVNRPESRGEWTPEVDHEIRLRDLKDVRTPTTSQNSHRPGFPVSDRELLPGQPRSLSGIGFRSFALGQALGLSLAAALYLNAVSHNPVWRAPFFVTVLALFHFLEFWTTARYNTPSAKTASFLFSNGKEYQMAHSAAMLEHLVTRYFFADWHSKVTTAGLTTVLGIALIALGQTVRSVAMAQAGTNFNHMVQSKKNSGHELVTDGIYAWLRHPSYFGFFWWGLGTQLMLGNAVCFAIYAAVLWRFFSHRIMHEEKFLINFFGDEYRKYRARTTVAIPFIP